MALGDGAPGDGGGQYETYEPPTGVPLRPPHIPPIRPKPVPRSLFRRLLGRDAPAGSITLVALGALIVLAVVSALIWIGLRPDSGTAHVAGPGGPGSSGGPSGSAGPSATASPVPGAPVAPDFAKFSKWSDPATWGGKPPVAGQALTIPKGKQVLVDVDVPKLGHLSVLGELAFADRATTFRARSIMVHGTFWLGTDANPMTKPVTVALEGAANDKADMDGVDMGANAFTAMAGGRIEIHGKNKGKTWTRLAKTAAAGATSLTLMEPVTWDPGDEIVVASSDVDVDNKERVKVTSRSADGKTVTINRALKKAHASVVTSQASGGQTRSVPERAEVGLLSHTVKITGPADAARTKIGGHVMVMGGGVLRMSYAELFAMGQLGRLGRYPIHWHFAGDGGKSHVSNVSVRDSFNRFVTIHRTNNVHVDGVVADETYGHGFFLEDGVETGNVIANNLVMGVRYVPNGKAIRKSDAIPSGFWISHPSNDLTGNSAAGGEGAGIWYDFNNNSDNTNLNRASDAPFGRMENNTAHSHKFTGGNPFPNEDQGTGISIEGYSGNFSRRGTVKNSNVWKNDGFGLWIDGAVTAVDTTAANNGLAVNCQNTVVKGGLLLGVGTANTGREAGHVGGLLRFYHGQCDVDGTWLGGFARVSGASPELVAITDAGSSTWDATNRVRGLKFFGGGSRVLFGNNGNYFDPQDVDHSHWFADLDGCVRGDGKPTVITNRAPMLADSREAKLYPRAGTGYYAGADLGFASPYDKGFMRVRFGDTMEWKRTDGLTGRGANSGLLMGKRYEVSGGGPRSDYGFDINGTDTGWVDLVFPWSGGANPTATYEVFGNKKNAGRASSASSLGDNQYYVDTAAGKLYLRIAIRGAAIPFGQGGDLDSLKDSNQYWNIG